MQVFISWSGPRSRAVAAALNDWLPRVIQAVKPFYSPDIEKGARWSSVVDKALEGTSFGILCLTRDNLRSEWIHYEAGGLSRTADALIWTFLLDLQSSEVGQPLGKYQHTTAEKGDVWKLVQTINARLSEPLADSVLSDAFDAYWPKLEDQLRAARDLPLPRGAEESPREVLGERDVRAMFGEILDLLRAQERRAVAAESPRFERSPGTGAELLGTHLGDLRVRRAVVYWKDTAAMRDLFVERLSATLPEFNNKIFPEDVGGSQVYSEAFRLLFNPTVPRARLVKALDDSADAIGVDRPDWSIIRHPRQDTSD